jgi:hypothetical protein
VILVEHSFSALDVTRFTDVASLHHDSSDSDLLFTYLYYIELRMSISLSP